MTFAETGLGADVLRALEDMSFIEPTPIQAQSIPAILETENDLIALAQTGTGKTGAFGLPIVHNIKNTIKTTQALILCPTRELCLQISKEMESFAKYSKGLKTTAVYGGTDIQRQIKELRNGVQIVIATPGRAIDLIERRALNISHIDYLVLDEADEMLNMGFKEAIDRILQSTPSEKRTLLFSATMPGEIANITRDYMKNPTTIEVGRRNAGAEKVDHHYYAVRAHHRYEAIKRVVDINPDIYGIVFCRTRRETKEVADKLVQDGYNADAIYGDLSQNQRDHVMNKFRTKQITLLVATDVAARGIDVNDITHVINYNLPDDNEVYIHRSGRTGRAGKQGISITIIHSKEVGRIRQLERMVKKEFERKLVPNGYDVCKKQLFKLLDRIENVKVEEEQIGEFLPEVIEKLSNLDREELIKRVVSVEFNQFLNYYSNSQDLNIDLTRNSSRDRDNRDRDRGGRDRDRRDRGRDRDRGGSRDRDRGDRGSRSRRDDFGGRDFDRRPSSPRHDENFVRYHINVGSKQQINAARILGIINENVPDKKVTVGKIDIMKNFSFVDIDADHAKSVEHGFENAQVDGQRVELTKSKPKPEGRSRR